MKPRAIGLAVTLLTVAGCGGAQHAATPEPPKLPRALAQSWAQQADAIAVALDAGDGCTAQRQAVALRFQVAQAVNAHQVPSRYLAPLVAAANDLVGRVACTPAPVVTTHGKSGKHGKHGGDNGGGD